MRIAAGIEYDGSAYAGWQRQGHALTVQAVVEEAFAKVAAHPTPVVCAGRTDAGVHALCQVIHFDTSAFRSERAWVLGTNSNLPDDVNVLWARPVPDTFHARFSATARTYRYVILNRWVRSGLERRRAAWVHAPLDESRMAEAGRHLLGEHDFSAYRAVACQARSPWRNVHALEVRRDGDRISIEITANAFLHHMVRNIAGVLIAIGKGERDPEWARELLEGRDRTLGGVTAPPEGLYFVAAHYPAAFDLPVPASSR